MIFLSPRPSEKESVLFYRDERYLPFTSFGEKRSLTGAVYRFVRRMNLRWKRGLVDGYWRGGKAASPGRLLDVGCGTGEFLVTMRKAGWEVEGIETNPEASAWVRKNWGIPVHEGDVRDLPPSRGSYDVITLWHVIEHIYDPAPVLRKLRTLLNSRGFLLVATPNVAGFDSTFYKEQWIALDVPRHVNHFSNRSLKDLFEREGFASNACRQLPIDAWFNTVMSEHLAAGRSRLRLLLFPFRLVRAAIISIISLVGGSRLFSARYGATVVCSFRLQAEKTPGG